MIDGKAIILSTVLLGLEYLTQLSYSRSMKPVDLLVDFFSSS